MTASILNTHVRDNMKVGRGFARAVRTAGNLTLNSTAWANTSTALDLTLAASTGDVVRGELSGRWSNEAVQGHLNLVCVASGAGFSTLVANANLGAQGWQGSASVVTTVSGGIARTLGSADISGGNVIVRIRHKTLTAANKTFVGSTATMLQFHANNFGPHVAP